MPENKPKSAIDEFLGDIPTAGQQQGQDIFDKPLAEGEQEPVIQKKEDDEPRKNRYHRRLEEKYQAEREANIALAARVEALTEAQKFARDTNADNIDENLIRLYGNDEKGQLAAKITADLLKKTEEQATQRALEAFEAQRTQEAEEVANYRAELDEYLEDIEDEFNVDLTSDSPTAVKARQGFFNLLNKVSPKNKEGVVTDFADPIATWELFQSQQKPENNRAKDLASRNMVKGGNSGDSKLEQTAQERWLRDAGII